MKIVAIIQARIGSTRLPFKMMLSLHGDPVIKWVVHRVRKSRLIDDIIVAIPISEENDILEKYLQKLKVKVYRGSESNVLSRFVEASDSINASHIVRVCADNPLVDGVEIDNLINFYQNNSCDYAYNNIPKNNNYPDGLGAEILSFELLKKVEDEVTQQHHKEHCLSYVTDNVDKFNIQTFNVSDKDIAKPNLRFDIDTFDDYYKLSMKEINIDITSKKLIQICEET